MSYQVLARKWRPQTFHQLVGQEHVKQALVNALNEQRLHHAYLFTGTRGVGKTTIARIFAKSLNCEQGISAQPCGQCSTCVDIEAGRYIDLIEIDAASRTKVEDTREILDNVQYAPTRGQFKVYLIDEVHMLSKHSFNALLKTLEEPPEHVKFLLATTDPQKLPVTILSRCLQFNLSALSVPQITSQLQHILEQEEIQFESPALDVLAKSADGSMRDALSLTDQAIAQTNAQLQEAQVKEMLGLMDVRYAQQLLSAVLLQDGDELMQQARNLATRNPNYIAVLDDLLNLTHSIQLTQLVPSAAALSEKDSEYVSEVAQTADAQHIHLLYQLLLSGKRDLQWASSAQVGFEMLLLRLLAFEPVNTASNDSAPASPTPQGEAKPQQRAANLRAMLAKNNADMDKPSAPDAQVSANPEQASTTTVPSPETDKQGTAHSKESANEAGVLEQDKEAEAQVAQQFAAVMSEAEDMGYSASAAMSQSQEDVSQPLDVTAPESEQQAQQSTSQNEARQEQSDAAPVEQLHALEQQTQSAIARILQNRKLGTGKPSAASGGTPKKSEARGERAQLSPPNAPYNNQTADERTPSFDSPGDSHGAASYDEPVIQPRQSNATKRNQSPAERLLERHQPDPQKLAPELLQQLEPTPLNDSPAQPSEQIPVPEGFSSPISDIKYAQQQDEWAALIDAMELGGRTRQFALHSVYYRESSTVTLNVHQEQQHLDGEALRERIKEGLSVQLGETIDLQVQFVESVESTPFLIQQQIDQQRLAQAVQTVHNDHNVQRLITQFSATLDENSVQAL